MEKRQSFDINPKAIWVTNLPYHTPESEIREVFEKYGKIVKVDSHDNGHRPYTFVHYETEEAAREAIIGGEFSIPKCDPRIEELLRAMLNMDPNQRPDAEELLKFPLFTSSTYAPKQRFGPPKLSRELTTRSIAT